MEDKINQEVFTAKKLSIATIAILITILLIFFLIPYLVTQKEWMWCYSEETGKIGDSLGGIVGPVVAFAGVILTFLAFYIQYKANQVQIEAFNDQKDKSTIQERQITIQQFENNFFELLKIHRENVKEMSYRGYKSRNVFVKIVEEYLDIMQNIIDSKIVTKHKLDEQDLANISFIILYLGVDDSVKDALENRLFYKYPKIYDEIEILVDKIRRRKNDDSSEKYNFNGHQVRLGHYYRHLRRCILYVHRNPIIDTNEKKEYIRTLRAQLSNNEQTLLFFFSISDIGSVWELETKTKETLISDYHLVRNIQLGTIYGFKPNRYYPNLKMEFDFEVRT